MRQGKFWFAMSGMLAVLAMALMLPADAVAASKYKLLHRFKGRADGRYPYAGLVFDSAGNLYGTTLEGGSLNAGTVFKLAPNSDGSWKESVLYAFTGSADGGYPLAGLILDAAGNLYGTKSGGGNKCPAGGCGGVFKLTPNSDGSWTENSLHMFTSGADGNQPMASLIFDAVGNLYGTTTFGGNFTCDARYGCGVVFKLSMNSHGSWTESVLHTFTGPDGEQSYAGLTFDPAGNLYGTTVGGGTYGNGTVFKLAPNSDGSWTESVLHSFTGRDGSGPNGGVIFDHAGNLYGTTVGGGSSDYGAIFKLTPNSDGSWTESVLYSFANHPGANPMAGLVFDAAGSLYGTTVSSGNVSCGAAVCGTVFKLTPNSDGSWTETVLHIFQGKPAETPYAGVVLDKAGDLYGTTYTCVFVCHGLVFEISP